VDGVLRSIDSLMSYLNSQLSAESTQDDVEELRIQFSRLIDLKKAISSYECANIETEL